MQTLQQRFDSSRKMIRAICVLLLVIGICSSGAYARTCAEHLAATEAMPGAYIPQCSADGNYKPEQCHHSIASCYCVDTITGSEINGTRVRFDPANCSLGACHEFTKALSNTAVGEYIPWCSSDGLYQPKQCHPSTGECWCVDIHTNKEILNTRARGAIDCPIPGPCDKAAAAVEPMPGAYVPQCEQDGTYKRIQCDARTCWCVHTKTNQKLRDTDKARSEGDPVCPRPGSCHEAVALIEMVALGTYVPQCEEDGSFKQVQCHPSIGMCWCVTTDTNQKLIGTDSRGSPQCPKIGSCQEKQALIEDAPGTYKPQCEQDGRYSKIQCHSSAQSCWCVNPNNNKELQNTRRQTLDKSQLDCPKPCHAESEEQIPGRYVPQCADDGYYLQMQCHHSVGSCWCVEGKTNTELPGTRVQFDRPKCPRRDSCQEKNALLDVMPGVYVPSCEEDGKYSQIQCHSGACWCVRQNTNEEIPSTRVTNAKPTCPTGPCSVDLAFLPEMRPGLFVPKCEADGSYSQEQCHGSECYCARKHDSKKIPGTNKPRGEALNCPKPGSCQEMMSFIEAMPGAYVPQCENDGRFTVKQCHRSTNYCWCVNPYTNDEIEGTRGKATDVMCEKKSGPCNDETNQIGFPTVGKYVPQCDKEGMYAAVQCHPGVGECWCVSQQTNEEMSETRIQGSDPDCKERAVGRAAVLSVISVYLLPLLLVI